MKAGELGTELLGLHSTGLAHSQNLHVPPYRIDCRNVLEQNAIKPSDARLDKLQAISRAAVEVGRSVDRAVGRALARLSHSDFLQPSPCPRPAPSNGRPAFATHRCIGRLAQRQHESPWQSVSDSQHSRQPFESSRPALHRIGRDLARLEVERVLPLGFAR